MADFQTGLYQGDEQKRNKKALMDQMVDTPQIESGGMPTQPQSPYDPAHPPSGLGGSKTGGLYGPTGGFMDGAKPAQGPAATTQPVGNPFGKGEPVGTKGAPGSLDHTSGIVDVPPLGPGMPTQPPTQTDTPPPITEPAGGGVPPVTPPGQKPPITPGQPTTPTPPNQPGNPTNPAPPATPGVPPVPNPGPMPPPPPATPPGAINPNAYKEAQDKLLRDALIAQMSQGTNVSVEDPNIKQQLDPFRAEQERARREAVGRGAEQAFASGQDFGGPEKAMAAERAGQATGLRASELVGKELSAKRDEIQHALDQFGGKMDADQKDKLTRDLADLDAQLKREGYGVTTGEGAKARELELYKANQENQTKLKALDSESGWRTYIADLEAKSRDAALKEGGRQADQQNVLDRYKTDQAFASNKYQTDRGFDMDKLRLDADSFIRKLGLEQTGTLANRELDIRDKLGMAGMNAEMTRMLLQDKQFRDRLGFDISKWQGDMNRDAVMAQLQG